MEWKLDRSYSLQKAHKFRNQDRFESNIQNFGNSQFVFDNQSVERNSEELPSIMHFWAVGSSENPGGT